MKNSYPTNPITSDPTDIMCLRTVNLGDIKQYVDGYGIQFELTMKPDGLRLTVVKKYKDKSVRRKSIDMDNGDYSMFQVKFMAAIQELQMMGM